MKKITSKYVTQVLFALFWVLAFQANGFAQNTGTYISWSNQVGCITYDSEGEPNDPKKRIVFIEDIENSSCVRVCEQSTATYTVNGPNISTVQWSAAGGTIAAISGANNTNATINWGAFGNGAIDLTIIYTNNTQRSITLCVEIINGPKASFDIYGVGENIFCLNTPINFHNLSNDNGGTEIVYYQWDFGDGNFSNAFEPTHTFDQPGSYKVRLTVTNKCNCSSSYDIKIEIVDKPNVVISCASVVCEDDRATYTVNEDCGGEWKVEGGTIISNSGTEIEVVWDQVGADGFGSVSYLSRCACPFWTTVKIPVVKKTGEIQGQDTLCLDDQGIYTLPQWPSTEFTWTLSPNPNNLVFLDQRNQVVVDALQPGIYVLRCTYRNTLIGCVGVAEKRIVVIEGTEIIGADSFCGGTTTTYQTTSGSAVSWELKQNNTVVASSNGITFTYNFPTGGVYVLTATVPGGCSGEPKVISVTPRPATPTGPIVGDVKICPGVPYEYTLNNTVPNTVLVWSVSSGGTFQGDNTGNNVSIVFNSSPSNYVISVVRQSLDGLACASPKITLNVSQFVVSATITNGSGLTTFCPSTQTTFTANLNGLTPDLVEWVIEPANFGNIISGGSSNTVTVSWNEISSPSNGVGNLKLRVKKCGVYTDFNKAITLQAAPNLTLTGPGSVCYGSTLNFNLTSSTTLTSGTITWNFGNGFTTTTPVNSSSNYSFANPYNNTTGSNINYPVVATLNLPNGCNYSVTATQNLVVFPRTIITVTPGYNYIVCPSSYQPFNLNANATTGIGVTASYQWYKNSSAILGATGSVLPISGANPGGTYYVRVTDSNSCVTVSQNIIVTEDCGPIVPCTITPDPQVSLTANWTQCNTVAAQLSFIGTGTVQWIGSPFLTYISGNTSGAQFSTTIPGAHLITAKVTFQTPNGPCTVTKTVEVIKHYQPNFNTNIVCDSSTGKYNITLLNNSTVFGITPANPITYTFSGPGIPTQVGQSINVPNLSAGNHTFTLTLSMAGMPSCSITKTVTLNALPTVDFTIAGGNVYCAEEQISLTIPNYNAANSYRWLFNGTSYVASGPTTVININTAGTYGISLQGSNPYGCSFTGAAVPVTIKKATFTGTLTTTPVGSICEGTLPSHVISFAPGTGNPAMPSSYIWMKGNVQVATTTANAYTPTSTGSYWAILIDSNGCRYTNLQPVSIIVRQKPYAGITGNSNVCLGEQTVLQGVVTNNTLQRRWLLNNSPMAGVYGAWATTTPLTVAVSPSTPGNYTYTFEVRPATDVTCGSSASMLVTVNPQVVAPVITFLVDTCEPYKVILTASGPSTGVYNWTNGATGQTIEVTYGGVFGVTYTAPTGCKASGTKMIPHPTDRALWVFPSGCYDICLNTSPMPYVIGPLGVFNQYKWLVNNQVAGSGVNSQIQNLPVTQAGAYQLTINNNGCDYESEIMNIAPNLEECEINPCDLKVVIREIRIQRDYYILTGYIYNPNSFSVTVTISSFNNYGTYTPGVVTIAPYTTYNFSPLYFMPNSNFTGGDDYMVVQMRDCMSIVRVRYPRLEGGRTEATDQVEHAAVMNIVPNPAESTTTISYDLGSEYVRAESITVYNLLGTPLVTEKIEKLSGSVAISTAMLASGTYIVSIQADGVRALQQTLIKK